MVVGRRLRIIPISEYRTHHPISSGGELISLTAEYLGLDEVVLVTDWGENGDVDTGEEVAQFVQVTKT